MLTLNTYIAQLSNPQVSFGVKPRVPGDLDTVVTLSMKLESFLTPKASALSVSEPPTDRTTFQPEEKSVGTVEAMERLANVEKLADEMER